MSSQEIPDDVLPQVIQMISDGMSARKIAQACGIVESTAQDAIIKYHLFRAIQVEGRKVIYPRNHKS